MLIDIIESLGQKVQSLGFAVSYTRIELGQKGFSQKLPIAEFNFIRTETLNRQTVASRNRKNFDITFFWKSTNEGLEQIAAIEAKILEINNALRNWQLTSKDGLITWRVDAQGIDKEVFGIGNPVLVLVFNFDLDYLDV